jgi:hypothetical protein
MEYKESLKLAAGNKQRDGSGLARMTRLDHSFADCD